ncbi:hypothetical protein RRG08_041457 [Elysia crispata]|uniref:Uncharacterized protein n=1 Tax=Elysia crispata TaxID=231223 RepID=A0AAE0Y2F7_9GAST|nr:hypothetical protein RRG08_041457 [Elysia crispata]
MPQPEYNDGQSHALCVFLHASTSSRPGGTALMPWSRLPTLPYTPDEEDETYDINCVPEESDDVFVRNFSLPTRWQVATWVSCRVYGSFILQRHQDQIRTSVHLYTEDPISDSLVNEDSTLPQGHRPRSLSVDSDSKDNSVQEQITSPSQKRIAEEETRESSHDSGREKESTQSGGGGVEPMVTTETIPYRTRSCRIVKPPDRFHY